MRHLLIAALSLAPAAALADACHDEIAALFDGGPLDSAARPPHRQIKEVRSPDGDLLYTFEARIASATTSIAGIRDSGNYAMAIGNKTWLGPGIDGPWTPSTDMPGDMEAAQAQVVASQRANLAETECPGLTDHNGKTFLTYRFRTRTDPDPARGNSWWGSKDTVYLDPGTGRVMIWEQTEHIASWSPDMTMERHVITLDYDDSIAIAPPD